MNLTPISNDVDRPATVISLSMARSRYMAGKYKHNNLIVDEELNTIECKDCGEKLNPISVLARYAKQETRLQLEQERLRELHQKLDERSRCKCDHCGKMTRIKL